MPFRRDILTGIVVLIVAFAAALLWLRRPGPEGPRPAGLAVAVAPAPDAPEAPAAAAPRGDRPRVEVKPPPRDESTAEKVARYRRRALFPPSSRPIDDGIDPIASGRAPAIERSGEPDDPGPALVTFPALTSFEAPASVVLYAQVVEREEREKGQRGAPADRRLEARAIRADVRGPAGVTVATLVFTDDGRDGDAEAGDRFFTATFTPDPDRPAEFRGRFTVMVAAETMTGEQLAASTAFVYAVPVAHLTGRYRDQIVDGHLQIEAEALIETPVELQLEGTLASSDAVLLGYARTSVTLEPGTTWIPLTFWGLILREQNVNGPYTLWSVTLATVGDGEAQASDVVASAYTTAAYRVTDFTDLPFNDPKLLEAADRLERGRPAS